MRVVFWKVRVTREGVEGAAAVLGGEVEGHDEIADADLLDGFVSAVGHENGGAGEETARIWSEATCPHL